MAWREINTQLYYFEEEAGLETQHGSWTSL